METVSMLTLNLELLSPLCAGAGTGRSGYVDREAAFDALGLPYLPGRALKGLLRDAYRELPGSILPTDLPGADELFGKPGEENAGRLVVGNAYLVGHERLAEWLAGAYAHFGGTIHREDVMACCTEIRRQTAIDRQTGAALKETLRATRVVRRGLRFEAQVSGVQSPADRAALALAAAALQQMGTSRTRGLGEVRCRVIECGADLTEQTLNLWQQNERGWLIESSQLATEALPVAARAGPPDAGKDLSQLRFRLRLEGPMLVPAFEGDANTVLTEGFIPGSAIRGLLARRYLAGGGKDFERLFLSGEVKFLSALPAAEGRRFLPVPHSVRQDKEQEALFYDFAVALPASPARRVRGWCAKLPVSGGERAETRTGLHYHHARARDRRIGRAVGEQFKDFDLTRAEAGAVFTYECLDAGQIFYGALIGPREALSQVRDLLADGEVVWLGRSRSAQYGRTKWEWIDAEPRASNSRLEMHGWENDEAADFDPGDLMAVVLLAPLLGRNQFGHPAPEFPVMEFARSLGLAEDGLQPEKSFVRAEWLGAYLSHLRLPRQQILGLAPGSIFIFKATRAIDADRVRQAQLRSYGMRQEDGFGRIAILTLSELQPRPNLPSHTSPAPPRPRFDSDADLARDLALAVLRGKVAERSTFEAIELARRLMPHLGAVSNHLLARVAGIVAHRPLVELAARLDEFREKARRQMQGVRSGNVSLWGELRLERMEGSWQAAYRYFLEREWQAIYEQGEKKNWPGLFATEEPPLLHPEEGVVKNYLFRMLGTLMRSRRGQHG
jgi:CRISPR-associated protein Csx10